jgi:hypothetical protein
MRRRQGVWAAALLAVVVVAPIEGQSAPGVPPRDARHCPDDHPVKGYADKRGKGVFYPPGSPQYDQANPERCFASEGEAREAGYRSARNERLPTRERR